ncbi:MAG: glycosyltransferase family 2 protein [Saprospiraceae bacterium]|nr:glycosyltransferase family 2 protein [Saprospiraceae bacterium]MBK8483309.1 glycosyltransferase family 2 protein [Saprospiraceae bacterium]MBK9729357.1 glycosyltransferase family 2 protein [Saprospiraceae bacterium]
MQLKLSIVVCVYNEEQNILPLIENINRAIQDIDYEILFVDDGSTDSTLQKLKQIQNSRLKIIEFRRNYGQSAALAAGIEYATGNWIATMDGDLQNDPEDIPRMLKIAEERNLDMLAGIRQKRQDGFMLRKIPSKIANWMIRNASDVHLHDYGCTLKILKADLAKSLGIYGELHRFIPVLADLEGARMDETPVKHHARTFGSSKYGINRTMRVFSDLLLILYLKRFRHKPMHLFGGWGVLLTGLGSAIMFYLLGEKLLGHDIWGRPILILGTILIMAGLQLIVLGILSEMQVRTYYESQGKKTYRVRHIYQNGLRNT